MRYLWINSNTKSYAASVAYMEERGVIYVHRHVVWKSHSQIAFITSKEDFEWMMDNGFADPAIYWTISTCNKQYVTAHQGYGTLNASQAYEGCMKEVPALEAVEWTRESLLNWSLTAAGTMTRQERMYWIPVQNENPARVIPGLKKMDKDTRHLTAPEKLDVGLIEVNRMWPLKTPKSDAFVDWFNEQKRKQAQTEYLASVEMMHHKYLAWRTIVNDT